MYLLLGIISAVIGASVSHGNLGAVPFSELTINMLLGNFFAVVCYIGAMYFGFKSLEKDRIWPWRWTLPYLGNLIAQASISALYIYGGTVLVEKKHLDGLALTTMWVVVGIFVLTTFFSSEFKFFKEKKETDETFES